MITPLVYNAEPPLILQELQEFTLVTHKTFHQSSDPGWDDRPECGKSLAFLLMEERVISQTEGTRTDLKPQGRDRYDVDPNWRVPRASCKSPWQTVAKDLSSASRDCDPPAIYNLLHRKQHTSDRGE
ncbi:MAG: hypothetical protein HY343_07785 [Lentisphaerae bacterium]|nr:hypothetical protein [Lentisphaerota bacterium]